MAGKSTGKKKTTAKKKASKKVAVKKKTVKKKAVAKKKSTISMPVVDKKEKTTAVEVKIAEKQPETKKELNNNGFVPNIVAFACNWCSYAGADNAGVNRIQYSPNFRVIRTMCSGRVTPGFVLKALKMGADGVLVSGCHFGDCHYIFGNYKAVDQFDKTKALVKTLGLDDKRIRLEWVSAAEGPRWAEVINEFVEQITELGPSPLNNKPKYEN